MKTALVIIHLSSLDSFTDLEYEATGERDDGYALASELGDAVLRHKGPVIIVDQLWRFVGRESRPREHFLEEIGMDFDDYEKWGLEEEETIHEQKDPRKITWITFDEQDRDWDEFLSTLEGVLKKLKVTNVLLGGLFYSDNIRKGCVNYTYRFLKKKKIPTKTVYHLLGYEGAHCEDDEDLPGGYTRCQEQD